MKSVNVVHFPLHFPQNLQMIPVFRIGKLAIGRMSSVCLAKNIWTLLCNQAFYLTLYLQLFELTKRKILVTLCFSSCNDFYE